MCLQGNLRLGLWAHANLFLVKQTETAQAHEGWLCMEQLLYNVLHDIICQALLSAGLEVTVAISTLTFATQDKRNREDSSSTRSALGQSSPQYY